MVCSSVWRIERGMRLFIFGPCLFLVYIFRLGQLGYELSIFFKGGKLYSERCISSWEFSSGRPVSWNHDEYEVLLYSYRIYFFGLEMLHFYIYHLQRLNHITNIAYEYAISMN